MIYLLSGLTINEDVRILKHAEVGLLFPALDNPLIVAALVSCFLFQWSGLHPSPV